MSELFCFWGEQKLIAEKQTILDCKFMIDWLIVWFLRNVNPFRIILCQKVRESHSLYVHINIFCLFFFRSFLRYSLEHK